MQPQVHPAPACLALSCFGLIWVSGLLTIPIAAATGLAGPLGSVLIGAVIGGICTGLFTEVEAASVGVIGAFAVTLPKGAIRRGAVWTIMRETTATVEMVYLLIFGATSFSFVTGISGLPSLLVGTMTSVTQEPLLIIVRIG